MSMLTCQRLRTHVRLGLLWGGVFYIDQHDIPVIVDRIETILEMHESN